MNKFLNWIVVLSASLVFGTACHGQAAAGEHPPVTISGTVRDPSGAPAAGVLVTLSPGHYPEAPHSAEVTTDKNGRYEMILQLHKPASQEGFEGFENPTNFILARDLARNLAAIREFNFTPTNMDFNLEPGITLSGSVKDTNGRPVTNALVDLTILTSGWQRKVLPRLATTNGQETAALAAWHEKLSDPGEMVKVDSQGAFSMPALPQGREYNVEDVFAEGFGTGYAFLSARDSRTNRHEFPVIVLKRADQTLAGKVLDRDGRPVAGADVYFYGAGQPRDIVHSTTDGAGQYAFERVCAGQVKMHVSLRNPLGGMKDLGYLATEMHAQAGDTNIVLTLPVSLVHPAGR